MSDGKFPSEDLEKFLIRLTADGMRDRLKTEAKRNGRSLNAEINIRLERSFEATAVSLDSQIAQIVSDYVEKEVQRRLRAIASQIGGAS